MCDNKGWLAHVSGIAPVERVTVNDSYVSTGGGKRQIVFSRLPRVSNTTGYLLSLWRK